jgi:hypothetical protein
MADMRSIINVIKDLRDTVTLMENRASGNRDEVERLKYDVRMLELWAGLTSDTDSNCNIQHVSNSEAVVDCGNCKWQYAKWEYKCEECNPAYKNCEQDTDC